MQKPRQAIETILCLAGHHQLVVGECQLPESAQPGQGWWKAFQLIGRQRKHPQVRKVIQELFTGGRQLAIIEKQPGDMTQGAAQVQAVEFDSAQLGVAKVEHCTYLDSAGLIDVWFICRVP